MLLENVKITVALAYASGTAGRTGAILDMKGWTGCLILVHSAAVAALADYAAFVQTGAQSALQDAAVLGGSRIVIADNEDNEVHKIDVKPRERYLRLDIDKDGNNTVAESAIYIQYGPIGVDTPVVDADGTKIYEPDES